MINTGCLPGCNLILLLRHHRKYSKHSSAWNICYCPCHSAIGVCVCVCVLSSDVNSCGWVIGSTAPGTRTLPINFGRPTQTEDGGADPAMGKVTGHGDGGGCRGSQRRREERRRPRAEGACCPDSISDCVTVSERDGCGPGLCSCLWHWSGPHQSHISSSESRWQAHQKGILNKEFPLKWLWRGLGLVSWEIKWWWTEHLSFYASMFVFLWQNNQLYSKV